MCHRLLEAIRERKRKGENDTLVRTIQGQFDGRAKEKKARSKGVNLGRGDLRRIRGSSKEKRSFGRRGGKRK